MNLKEILTSIAFELIYTSIIVIAFIIMRGYENYGT